MDCVFCVSDGGKVLWRDARLRIVLADERHYPAFCRVIWNAHVREMSDLSAQDRAHCMQAVFAAEEALRALVRPDKMNLASLGNQVPHVHWHIIARFEDDRSYPNPIWGKGEREGAQREFPDLVMELQRELKSRLAER